MHLRSHLSKARGLGSAHEGSHHWWMQRLTAIALIPLVVWFVVSVIKATQYHDIDGVVYLLSSPCNAILMSLFLVTSIYHGTLGLQVIIEDYVHCPCAGTILQVFTKFVSIISTVAVIFAIFFIHIKSYDNNGKYSAEFWNGAKSSVNSVQTDGNKAPVVDVVSPQE